MPNRSLLSVSTALRTFEFSDPAGEQGDRQQRGDREGALLVLDVEGHNRRRVADARRDRDRRSVLGLGLGDAVGRSALGLLRLQQVRVVGLRDRERLVDRRRQPRQRRLRRERARVLAHNSEVLGAAHLQLTLRQGERGAGGLELGLRFLDVRAGDVARRPARGNVVQLVLKDADLALERHHDGLVAADVDIGLDNVLEHLRLRAAKALARGADVVAGRLDAPGKRATGEQRLVHLQGAVNRVGPLGGCLAEEVRLLAGLQERLRLRLHGRPIAGAGLDIFFIGRAQLRPRAL